MVVFENAPPLIIDGLKRALLPQEAQVVRCPTEKLLTYASGRRPEPPDRAEIDRIVAELGNGGNRLRDLIRLVVRSEIFPTGVNRATSVAS